MEMIAIETMEDILHIVSDFITFFGYGFTCIVFSYIYSRGQIHSIDSSHPDLWRRAILFLALASLARLSSLLQASSSLLWEIDLSLITATIKSLLAMAVLAFISRLWKAKSDLINLATIWREVREQLERRW